MNFSKIFNSVKGKSQQQIPDGHRLVETSPAFDADDFKPDMLGQSRGRFFYNPEVLQRAHSVDYETAFQVLETFRKIPSYERRMAFWQEKLTVFGYACIVVFDTHQKEYRPYYGRPFGALESDLSQPAGRYEWVSIFPSDVGQFPLFWEWCLENYLSWMSTVVKKESTHWEEIKTLLSENDYINGCLAQAIAEVESNDKLPAIYSQNLYTDEQAERYLFFFGSKEATWGKVDYAIDVPDIYTVLRGVITCPLSTYAEIISRYKYGYDLTVRIAFLQNQKERLSKGENVRVPMKSPTSQYHDVVVEQLHNLLKCNRRYDSLKHLAKMPHFQDLKPEAPDYIFTYQLINKYSLGGSIVAKKSQLFQSLFQAFLNFIGEYERNLELLRSDKIGRATYIKEVISKLYLSISDHTYLNKIDYLLGSDIFEELEQTLDEKTKEELNEIRLIAFYRSTIGFFISSILERDLQVEGITINNGWIMNKLVEPKDEAAEQSQIVIDLTPAANQVNDEQTLTVREKALIHCYKDGSVIKRGEPMYNDYIALATPSKRIRYPSDSEKKAKSLVASIAKILPYLTTEEMQQAQNEMDTINANFS